MANVKKRFSICAGKKYMKGAEEKTQWIKVGSLTVWDDGGISEQIDALPTGNWWDGKLSVFEEKPQDNASTSQPQSQQQSPTDDTGLPF